MGKSPEHHLRMRKFYFVVWALVLLAPLDSGSGRKLSLPSVKARFRLAAHHEYAT